MIRYLVLLSLTACSPMSGAYYPPVDAAADTAPPSKPAVCATPQGTVNRTTPETGYWAADCRAHCLPPKQVFSICTEGMGKLMTDATMELQSYGASWETKHVGCPDLPYRVWALARVVPSNVGKWSSPSIGSDCSQEAKNNTGPLPTGRFYYVPVEEVLPQVVQ